MHNESETACNLGPNQSSNMDVNQKNRGLLQANSNNADNKNIRGKFIICLLIVRDVSAGATGATAVAPKFSDTLTLSQPGGGADSTHHCRGRT